MAGHFYKTNNLDIERLAVDLENLFRTRGYQAQHIGNNEQMIVQLKKGSDFEAILGMQAVLTITIQRTAEGVMAEAGQQKWIDKAAAGAAGIAIPGLWPLFFTAGVGALRQAELANRAMNVLDSLIRQQQPNVRAQ